MEKSTFNGSCTLTVIDHQSGRVVSDTGHMTREIAVAVWRRYFAPWAKANGFTGKLTGDYGNFRETLENH